MERHTCLTQNQDFKGSNPFLPTILIENKLYNNIDAYSNTFMALTFNQNTYTIASRIFLYYMWYTRKIIGGYV